MPSATRAQRVTLADRATNAQRATNADNALALGGTAAAGYLSFASRTIPSGTTVTGAFGIGSNVTAAVTVAVVDPEDSTPMTPPTATATTAMTSDIRQVVQLPGLAPADLSNATVNFANGGAGRRSGLQRDAPRPRPRPRARSACTSRPAQGAGSAVDGQAIPGLAGSRSGFVVHATNATLGETGAFGTWAYTAP